MELNNLKDKKDNKSNLLFLIGNTRIFGWFIKALNKVENVKQENYIKYKDAFVFSLNNNKIYKILIPEYAIYYYDNYPLLIGNSEQNNGFWIYDGKINEGLLKNPKIYDFLKDNELTEWKRDFTELEILEINFN